MDVAEVGVVVVGAQGPYAVVASQQLGARAALSVEEHDALLAPSETTVGIDSHGDTLSVFVGEATHHAAVGGGGHGHALRPGGQLLARDGDAVGIPLRHAFKIEALQGGYPAVGAHLAPLQVGVARDFVRGEVNLASIGGGIGDESVGQWVVDSLCLQRGERCQSQHDKKCFLHNVMIFCRFVAAKVEKIVSLQHNNRTMEEKFTSEEQMAVASVLYNLADADFQSHEAERECLEACMKELEFDATGFVPIEKNQLHVKAYETLKRMSKEKKRAFSRMMTRLSRSDGHFGPREQAFVKEILIMCDVPFVHR